MAHLAYSLHLRYPAHQVVPEQIQAQFALSVDCNKIASLQGVQPVLVHGVSSGAGNRPVSDLMGLRFLET